MSPEVGLDSLVRDLENVFSSLSLQSTIKIGAGQFFLVNL